jgi:hypothetical protein
VRGIAAFVTLFGLAAIPGGACAASGPAPARVPNAPEGRGGAFGAVPGAPAGPVAAGVYRVYRSSPLAVVLMDLAALARQDIVIGDGVRGLVTLPTSGQPAADLLAGVARAHGCSVDRVADLVVVRPAGLVHSVRPEDFRSLEPRFRIQKLSLFLSGVSLDRFLELVSREVSLALIARPPAGARIWVRATSRPLPDVLAAIALASGLACEIRPASVAFFTPGPGRR